MKGRVHSRAFSRAQGHKGIRASECGSRSVDWVSLDSGEGGRTSQSREFVMGMTCAQKCVGTIIPLRTSKENIWPLQIT